MWILDVNVKIQDGDFAFRDLKQHLTVDPTSRTRGPAHQILKPKPEILAPKPQSPKALSSGQLYSSHPHCPARFIWAGREDWA